MLFSVGRDCELVKTDQTIIRVEAEDSAIGQLAVTYSLPESETASILANTNQIQVMLEKYKEYPNYISISRI